MSVSFTKKIFLLFCIVAGKCTGVTAQSLSAVIADASTNAPVGGASIMIPNTREGVISNDNGYFEIQNFKKNDSIIISYVGYQTLRKPVSYFASKDTVFLEQLSNKLEDVVVSSIDPVLLLSRAITKSAQSLNRDVILDAYYKEYMKLDDTIRKYADGQVRFVIPPHKKKIDLYVDQSRTRAKYSSKDSAENIDGIYIRFKIQDVLQRYFPDGKYEFKPGERSEKYTYSLKTTDDDYIITVVPGSKNRKSYRRYEFYIDKTDSLIAQVYTSLEPGRYNDVAKNILIAKSRIKGLSYVWRYQKYHHKLYLSYLSARTKQTITSGILKFDHTIEVVSELITNHMERLTSANKPQTDLYRYKSLFSNGNKFKTAFWEHQPKLKPTTEEIQFLK